ncbi:CIA30 family protein [uncultured Brevundimonas sp.]|uniref:CIA30 family protein n=1 Tax=uncultured Brevundimonas sp. TaxID=213418 RepID=UPI0026240E74|nr:CIA30 family protein [uncultured Brevundimonas sp.]
MSLSFSIARRTLLGATALAMVGGFAAAPQDGVVAIVGATVFDATGAEPYRANVVIRDGRIAEVGPEVRAPRGARIIRAEGKALLPGFWDVHTHWTPAGDPALTPEVATAYVQAGVTTINDFHQPPESFEPRRRWLESLTTPHVNFTARMSTPGGHGADWADQNTTRWANTPEAGRAGVQAIAPYQPDLIKVFADGWRYGQSADNTSMDEWTLKAIVDEAHKIGVRVVTHSVTVERGAVAARAGVDIIAHSLQDRVLDDATVQLIKESGTAYAPTLAVYEPVKPGQTPPANPDTPRFQQSLRKFGFALNNVKRLHDAGVLIALGTDAGMTGTPHGTSTLREMELLVQAGLTPTQALMAGTANSAQAMGMIADRGTIEVGKRADLVLVNGRPWEQISDVRNTHAVLIDGRVVHGLGARLAAANSQPTLPAVTVGAVIDDFTRADGRTNLNTLRVEDFDGGQDRSAQISQIITDADGKRILSVSARMSQKENPTAGVIFPMTRGSIVPADLSGYRGVKLRLRGDGKAYELRLRGLQGSWSAAVTAGSEWTEVEVPFSALTPVPTRGGGQGPAFDAGKIFDVRVGFVRDAGALGYFEIQQISFY